MDVEDLPIKYKFPFEVDKEVVSDFCKIMMAFTYGIDIPLKSRLTFHGIQAAIKIVMKVYRTSLTWPYIELKHAKIEKVNKFSKIGQWLWTIGLPYPNPLYRIFPPALGNRHAEFMETCMTILNSMEMPKSDWQLLLNMEETLDEDAKDQFRKLHRKATELMWECFLVETHHGCHLKKVTTN